MKYYFKFYGKRLRILRYMNDMSMKDVADKVGLSKQAISKIEKGEFTPTKLTAVGLAAIFEVDIEYFTSEKLTLILEKNRIKLIISPK